MERTQAGCRRKHRRRFQQIRAWTALILLEILFAAVPTAGAAAVFLPLAYAERGYMAMGSEWLIIAAVFCITYRITHNRVCDKIFGQEG